MTLATHIGAPPQPEYGDPTGEATFHFGLLDAGEWGVRTVYQLVIFGVFERHPNLKLVLTEVPGVFWDEMCLKMDSLHESPIRRREQKTPRAPQRVRRHQRVDGQQLPVPPGSRGGDRDRT